MAARSEGRVRQRQRTRRDLLDAAGRLAAEGKKPTLEDVAAEAMVSRATAYRYFPSIEALWNEASLHVAFPQGETVFANGVAHEPAARLAAADAAIEDMIEASEPALRAMLAQAMESSLTGEAPITRQNRRTGLIDEAVDPFRAEFNAGRLKKMKRALAMLMGTEAAIVCKDVLRLNAEEARETRLWAIRALVEAARKEPK